MNLDLLLQTLRPDADPRPCLRRLRSDVYRLRHKWVNEGCRLKGLDPASEDAGEEWAMGPMPVLRQLRFLQEKPARTQFPASLFDACQYPRFYGKVLGGARPTMPGRGRGLVLGAGNVSAIAATDVLHMIFVARQAVLLKLSEQVAPMQPLFEEAFASLIDAGLLAIISGGPELGMQACRHPLVDHVHLTGSASTYKTIREAVPDKPITAELGCVTPVLVVPGKWSDTEVTFQAQVVAAMLSSNGGFSCNAAQVLITSREWPQREHFLEELRRALATTPPRRAFYRDAPARYEQWLRDYPQAAVLGERRPDCVPWTLVSDLDPELPHRAFQEEAFCGVLFETALTGSDYLGQAAEWANQRLWGDLSCCVIAHPAQQSLPAFDAFVQALRYGAVGVNLPPSLLFALIQFPWGAYPWEGAQSGVGFVHNAAGVQDASKGILSGPFWHPLRQPWQVGYTRMRSLLEAVTRFEYQPTWLNLLRGHVQYFRGALRW